MGGLETFYNNKTPVGQQRLYSFCLCKVNQLPLYRGIYGGVKFYGSNYAQSATEVISIKTTDTN